MHPITVSQQSATHPSRGDFPHFRQEALQACSPQGEPVSASVNIYEGLLGRKRVALEPEALEVNGAGRLPSGPAL